MEIFNIGAGEIILLLVILFVVLGPRDMARTAYKVGSWIRKLVKSPIWAEMMNTSQMLKDIPQELVKNSGLGEDLKDLRQMERNIHQEFEQSSAELQEETRQVAGTIQNVIRPEIPSQLTGEPAVEIEEIEEEGK